MNRFIVALRKRAQREAWAERLTCARERPGWRQHAKCAGQHPDRFFTEGGNAGIRDAREFCVGCPVRLDCLAACWTAERSTDPRFWYGVFGGLSPIDRKRVVGQIRVVKHRETSPQVHDLPQPDIGLRVLSHSLAS
jgi:hypothetical protein